MKADIKADMSQISSGRKLLYYSGMGLIVIATILFVSSIPIWGNDVEPSDPDFFERSREQTEERSRRSLFAMGLFVVGAIMMTIGARGAAGSGVVLDPQQARQDLKPWSRMGGGVVQDALSEVDILKKTGEAAPAPEVRVRCRKCEALNEEAARFCSQCGDAM